jgi:hypothetical protein
MTKNRARRRIEKVAGSSKPRKPIDRGFDWQGQRAAVANRATTLGPDFENAYKIVRDAGMLGDPPAMPPEPSDEAALHRAFKAHGLDPADPWNWRILTERLARVLYPDPGPSRGKREKSARLVEALRPIVQIMWKENNSAIANAFLKKHKKQFSRSFDHIRREVARLRRET